MARKSKELDREGREEMPQSSQRNSIRATTDGRSHCGLANETFGICNLNVCNSGFRAAPPASKGLLAARFFAPLKRPRVLRNDALGMGTVPCGNLACDKDVRNDAINRLISVCYGWRLTILLAILQNFA